jgi:tRNA G10  N-methylase Trm11
VLDEGWVREGEIALDPFGGIGGFILDGLRAGVNVVAVELEPRFVDLGQQNIDLWNARYAGRLPKWGQGVIVQGDSRRLRAVLQESGVALIASSPPYAESLEKAGGIDPSLSKHVGGPHSQMNRSDTRYGQTDGQLGAMPAGVPPALIVSSPPFRQTEGGTNVTSADGPLADEALIARHAAGNAAAQGYGASDGQLANMPEGRLSMIGPTSPPYSNAQAHPSIGSVNKDDWGYDGRDIASRRGLSAEYGDSPGNIANMPEGQAPNIVIGSPPFHNQLPSHDNFIPPHDSTKLLDVSYGDAYGSAPGQLAALPEGQAPAVVVTSPPYEASIHTGKDDDSARVRKAERFVRGEFKYSRPDIFTSQENIGTRAMYQSNYGLEEGQIGNDSGDTFWSAALAILRECHSVLKDGGHAVFVTKRYVRDGAIVDFSQQWVAACESVGFRLVHWHKALLTTDHGTQLAHDGQHKRNFTERKSFFRRLAEKKGSPRIDWEDILCFVKGESDGEMA